MKPHEERIGKANVKCLIFPNGNVMVYIACSNNPFKLEDEADESVLLILPDIQLTDTKYSGYTLNLNIIRQCIDAKNRLHLRVLSSRQ
jgi:hypothetical protein